MTPNVSGDRQPLRNHARALRAAISADERERATAAITTTVLAALGHLPAGSIVGLYAAMRGEVSTDAIAAGLIDGGIAIAYPRVVPGQRQLAFHAATAAELRPGRWTIPEPTTDAPDVSLPSLAAIVVPGLLFDHQGHRLGWGAGHYDATLPSCVGALTIGLAFERQRVLELHPAAHDVALHKIATEVALHEHGRSGLARKGTTT
jgi:5-formyltetrahydrofolate cyclo-ligase